jgi:hypothetical protein
MDIHPWMLAPVARSKYPSAQTTCALLCVRLWNQLGSAKDIDIGAVASLPEDEELDDG